VITIRPALPSEVDEIRSIARAAYAGYVERIGREPEPMTVDYAAEVAAGRVRVAVDGVRLVGFVVLVVAEGHLFVDNLAVAPADQGRGLGGQLLLHAEAVAMSLGLDELRLHTNEAMTENLDRYLRHGFAETHRATEHGYHRVFFSKRL
jgi:ribosomal protein S18 acetylase RimI-like enzyme